MTATYDSWCSRCDSEGKIPEEVYRDGKIMAGPLVKCPACDGTGYILTELGDELLKFLRRQGVIA